MSNDRIIGINIDGIKDYSLDRAMADVVKQARGVGTPGKPYDYAGPVGPDGWPSGDFGLTLVAGPDSPGTYGVTFTGRAKVSGVNSAVNVAALVYDPASNTTRGPVVVARGQEQFSLSFTQARRDPMAADAARAQAGGATGIRIMRPTVRGGDTPHPDGTLFSAPFLAFLADYAAIRFMDYLSTNSNTSKTWADRRRPGELTQADDQRNGQPIRGACLEYAIMLCNQTGKDMWINIPCLVDDDYVRRVAQMLRYGSDGVNPYAAAQAHPAYPPLGQGLRCYVEYSNEVWNYGVGFAQSNQNDHMADTEVKAGGSNLAYDGKTDYGVTGKRRVGRRGMEISGIFRSVFGDAAMGPVIRPMFMWQYNDANGTASVALEYLNNYFNNADGVQHVAVPRPVNYHFWGGGGAWYAGVANPGAATVDAIFASGPLGIAGLVAGESLMARMYGLRVGGYEGGFVIGADNPTTVTLAANLDPRTESIAFDVLGQFFAAGGEIAMIYSSTINNYSMTRNIDVADTPKIRAVRRMNKSGYPSVSVGSPLPVPALVAIKTGFYDPAPRVAAGMLMRADAAGDYSLALSGTMERPDCVIRAMVDGVLLPDRVVLPLAAYPPGYSTPIPFRVDSPGLHAISFTTIGPGRVYINGPSRVGIAPQVIRPGSVSYVGADVATGGDWRKRYGKAGSYVFGDKSQDMPKVATLRMLGDVWNYGATAENRGLMRHDGSGRLLAVLYSAAAAVVNLEITDGSQRLVTLYLCDCDTTARHERIDAIEGNTGKVLDSRDVANFHGGIYHTWWVGGSVRLAAQNLNPALNAVINGVFID